MTKGIDLVTFLIFERLKKRVSRLKQTVRVENASSIGVRHTSKLKGCENLRYRTECGCRLLDKPSSAFPGSFGEVCVIITRRTEPWMCGSAEQTRPRPPRGPLMNSSTERAYTRLTISPDKSPPAFLKRAHSWLFHFKIKINILQQ